MKRALHLITCLLVELLIHTNAEAQTKYNFSTAPTLSSPTWSIWKTRAEVTLEDIVYRMESGGNGSFSNPSTEGNGNSASLRKDGSGGDQFTLTRADGKPFQFYGFWVKHQSMNSYSSSMSLPPWYTITYTLADGTTETYTDNTPKQGNNTAMTTHATTFTKNLAVTSVAINFKSFHCC